MDNLLKLIFFNIVSNHITSDALWKKGEVFLLRIWQYFFIPESGRKHSHTNSYNFAMTPMSQNDPLTAGAWAACTFR